jgi:CHAT domain-containing protein
LAISRKAGNRSLEKVTLSNIANLLTEQNQPELAIIFYKQSVNIIEKIRNDLKVLPKEQQKSYTTTVAHIYRNLADLLLQQNRILEAQRVLDLLKVQELDDYLTNVRGNKQTSSGIELLPQEQKVALQLEAIQGKEILTGKELTQLRKLCKPKCTAQQEKRISELVKIQQLQSKKFRKFIKSDEVKALLRKLNETAQEQNLRLTNLNNLRDNLQKNAVLLYPLILKDRLELVLVSRDSPPIRRTVSVKREDLNRTIVEFRRALQNPNSNAMTPAKKLYQWLIKPIENDLTQAETKTIIYAPDGALRYIPLAALHDGKNWLVQRFNTHNITAASIDDLDTPRQTNLRVLAAAFSQGNYTFTLGSQQFNFDGLPFAGKEVENLSKTIQNTTKLLNKTFSANSTIPKMGNYNLVHLATHAAFVLGKPEDSFILFGNGDRVSLRDVENWDLTNVDLIVLSACETGVGDKFGNGEEILGFGYLMQKAGAKTSIASLWRVSDGGTQALMDAFYTALQNPKITKAEALKNAQVALITGDFSALGNQRAGIVVKQRIGENLSSKISNNLNHPYYWAPFILIGNGL